MFTKAIVRIPGRDFAQGLTNQNLGAPEYDKMMLQHQSYRNTLKELGLELTVLEPLEGYPDAYFVEDTAVMLEEAAVSTRPGADSRRGEAAVMKPVLERFKTVHHIDAPGTMDGGDVLLMGKTYFVGESERTNREGISQFASIVSDYGFQTVVAPVKDGLHLKSSVNQITDDTLIIMNNFAELDIFAPYNKIILNEDEAPAANTLRINDALLTPAGFPRVHEHLSKKTDNLIVLEMSEVKKMDGGLSCLSLRF